MTAEITYGSAERQAHRPKEYCSPEAMLKSSPLARQSLAAFLYRYVQRGEDGRLPGTLPAVAAATEQSEAGRLSHEVFSGYGGLGELVHVRADPYRPHQPDSYMVVCGNLASALVRELAVRAVDRSYRSGSGYETTLYLDEPGATDWPSEYQPMTHLAHATMRFTYQPGFGVSGSLLLPLAQLAEFSDRQAVPAAQTVAAAPLGQRALTLIHSV